MIVLRSVSEEVLVSMYSSAEQGLVLELFATSEEIAVSPESKNV